MYIGELAALSSRLRDVPRNTDDRPVVEFLAARHRAARSARSQRGVGGAELLRLSTTIRRHWQTHPSEIARRATAVEGRTADGGLALQTASTHWDAGEPGAAARALSRAAELLPPDLLANAPADPSAADVWYTEP